MGKDRKNKLKKEKEMKNTDKPNVPVPPPPVSAIQKDLQEELLNPKNYLTPRARLFAEVLLETHVLELCGKLVIQCSKINLTSIYPEFEEEEFRILEVLVSDSREMVKKMTEMGMIKSHKETEKEEE